MVIGYILTVMGGVGRCELLRYTTIRCDIKTDKDENIFTGYSELESEVSPIVTDINEIENGQWRYTHHLGWSSDLGGTTIYYNQMPYKNWQEWKFIHRVTWELPFVRIVRDIMKSKMVVKHILTDGDDPPVTGCGYPLRYTTIRCQIKNNKDGNISLRIMMVVRLE